MEMFMRGLFLGLIGAIGVAHAGEAASVDGMTVHLFLARPDKTSMEVDFLNRVVGPLPEVQVGLFILDVSGNSLTFSVAAPAVPTMNVPFAGFVMSDVFDSFGPFGSANFTASPLLVSGTPVVTFDKENLYVNMAGTNFATGSVANLGEILRVDFTIIPLPASLPLLLTGAGFLVLLGRRPGG